jgi:hypothetical protein
MPGASPGGTRGGGMSRPETTNPHPEITIGDFTFIQGIVPTGNLWLRHSSGEGMEVSQEHEEKLDALLKQFWKENF